MYTQPIILYNIVIKQFRYVDVIAQSVEVLGQ